MSDTEKKDADSDSTPNKPVPEDEGSPKAEKQSEDDSGGSVDGLYQTTAVPSRRKKDYVFTKLGDEYSKRYSLESNEGPAKLVLKEDDLQYISIPKMEGEYRIIKTSSGKYFIQTPAIY